MTHWLPVPFASKIDVTIDSHLVFWRQITWSELHLVRELKPQYRSPGVPSSATSLGKLCATSAIAACSLISLTPPLTTRLSFVFAGPAVAPHHREAPSRPHEQLPVGPQQTHPGVLLQTGTRFFQRLQTGTRFLLCPSSSKCTVLFKKSEKVLASFKRLQTGTRCVLCPTSSRCPVLFNVLEKHPLLSTPSSNRFRQNEQVVADFNRVPTTKNKLYLVL